MTASSDPSLVGHVVMGSAEMSLDPRRDRAANLAAVRAAADHGIRIFDAARVYVPDASHPLYSEQLMAEALAGRKDVLIGTKGGHFRTATGFAVDNSPGRLRQDVADSLRGLGVDRIALYYLHRADDETVPIEESVGALAELQAQGAIERIGVSNVTPEQLARAGSVATIDAVQNLHSAVGRESADVVLACERAGIAFFAYSPLRSDVALDAALPRLAAQASLRGVSVARLAIRALLASSPALSVVSGASRIETVRDAAAAPAEPWDADAAAAYREDLAAADGQER